MIIVGILLEICAAALGTTSKQLIAYSTHSGRKWCFHLGATINIFIGPLVDASAYGFAPQVVVAPFACLDVIFNMLTAPCTLRWQQEHITRYHILGTVLVAAGACFTAVFGSVRETNLSVYELEADLLKPASIAYMGCEVAGIIAVGMMLKAKRVPKELRGVALGCVAGVLMGNVFFMKGFLGILEIAMSSGDWNAFKRVTPYVCVVAVGGGSILGHLFMRKGLAEYKGVFMVTIFEGAHITAACLSGCVVLSELATLSWLKVGLYWCSVGTIVGGILIVNQAAGAAASHGHGEGSTREQSHTLAPRGSSFSSFRRTETRELEAPVLRSVAEETPSGVFREVWNASDDGVGGPTTNGTTIDNSANGITNGITHGSLPNGTGPTECPDSPLSPAIAGSKGPAAV